VVGVGAVEEVSVGLPEALSAGIVVVDTVLLDAVLLLVLSLVFFGRLGERLACKTASWVDSSFFRLLSSEILKTESSFFLSPSCFA